MKARSVADAINYLTRLILLIIHKRGFKNET